MASARCSEQVPFIARQALQAKFLSGDLGAPLVCCQQDEGYDQRHTLRDMAIGGAGGWGITTCGLALACGAAVVATAGLVGTGAPFAE